MDMGVTQVEDITEEEITAEYAGLLSKRADDEAMSVYDAQRKTVKEAIDILAAHVDAKKVLFAPRRSVSKAMFAEVAGDPKREYAFAPGGHGGGAAAKRAPLGEKPPAWRD